MKTQSVSGNEEPASVSCTEEPASVSCNEEPASVSCNPVKSIVSIATFMLTSPLHFGIHAEDGNKNVMTWGRRELSLPE